MPLYEVIYENGDHSIADYPDDEAALAACQLHHERATRGEKALLSDTNPNTPRAVRIVGVERYPDGVDPAGHAKDGVGSAKEPAVLLTAPHESNYAAESESLELPWQ